MRNEEEISRDKLFKKLCKKSGKTILDHHMLEDGDKVLAGLSGGKDSLILVEILSDRIRSLPFKVEMAAIHVTVGDIGYEINTDYLNNFCQDLGIGFIHKLVNANPDATKKSTCFVCSWHRRKAIFNESREKGYNKLAFGHHRDDALETFMMNLLYHGSISALPYSLSMFEGRVKLIRPLLDIWENDLEEYAGLRGFMKEEKRCPFDTETKRRYTREVIEKLAADYPKSKINMFKALDNIYGEYLPGRSKR